MEKVGGRLIWAGNAQQTLIGDLDSQPDRFLVVWYPSKEAFIELTSSEEYKAIADDRHLALEFGALIASETIS